MVFLCGPVVNNPPFNVEDVGLIPSQGTKILHALGQLSLSVATTQPMHHNWRSLLITVNTQCSK